MEDAMPRATSSRRAGSRAPGAYSGPNLTLWIDDFDDPTLRRVKQLGINHISTLGAPLPWNEAELKWRMNRLADYGMSLNNQMFVGIQDAIYASKGRDQAIENVIKSVRVAGRLGLPVMEYNWYAHRIVEGYKEAQGRGGAGYYDFDNDRAKGLAPLPEEGAHTREALWASITYFLKAVIPVAEKAGVRLALHPNDPPPPISRGSEQIMGSLADWKKLLDIVKSPSNGMTFDCGVTRELGEDPVAVCRYIGERDQINHMHFRNVKTHIPRLKYTEVFLDEGEVDMFAVMKELVRQKYPRLVYPEHPPAMDADREHPFKGISSGRYTGFAFTVGYACATLQAVLKTQ
jgi:mannonate dehydratase